MYLFDPGYLEWCIKEIDDFFIVDLKALEQFGVFPLRNESIKELLGVTNDPSLSPWTNEWESIQDYAKAVGYADTSYRFPEVVRKLNDEKVKKIDCND